MTLVFTVAMLMSVMPISIISTTIRTTPFWHGLPGVLEAT
jgi:hypothetical protein